MSPVTHRHPTRTVCSLIALCLIAAGCEKDPITTYTIDKAVDQPPVIAPTPPVRPVRPPDAAVAGAKGPVRLLGALELNQPLEPRDLDRGLPEIETLGRVVIENRNRSRPKARQPHLSPRTQRAPRTTHRELQGRPTCRVVR